MDHNCQVEPIQKSATPEEQTTTEPLRLGIVVMGRPTCTTRVRNGPLALKGVVSAEVDHVAATTVALGLVMLVYHPPDWGQYGGWVFGTAFLLALAFGVRLMWNIWRSARK